MEKKHKCASRQHDYYYLWVLLVRALYSGEGTVGDSTVLLHVQFWTSSRLLIGHWMLNGIGLCLGPGGSSNISQGKQRFLLLSSMVSFKKPKCNFRTHISHSQHCIELVDFANLLLALILVHFTVCYPFERAGNSVRQKVFCNWTFFHWYTLL